MAEPKKRGGKPEHTPSDEQKRLVESLVVAGVTHERIASIIGICPRTLARKYDTLLKDSRQQALGRNTVVLMNLAAKGNVSAAIYLQKCLGGPEWKEKPQIEVSGTVQTQTKKPNVKALSTDELKRLVELGKKCVSN
jgi:hypothetical protein